MNINLDLYKIFYTVAKNKNITKASKELLISQPAISKSIKNLEQQLGGNLFVRTKRGVKLTEEGEIFYNYIKKAMEYINNAENKFTDLIQLETGTIKIGISTTLTKEFLIPYMEEFHKLYPKINIEIITNVASELIDKLKNGLIDLIIMNLPFKVTDNKKIIKCKSIQDSFIVGEQYKHLLDKKISIKELNNYPLILQSKGSNTRNFLDDFASKYNVVLKSNIDLASYTLVYEFTKIGFGIGYATIDYLKDNLENKKIYLLKIKEDIPKRNIGIAISKKNEPSFSTKKLLNIILKDKEK